MFERRHPLIEWKREELCSLIGRVFPSSRVVGAETLAGGFSTTNVKITFANDERPVVLRFYPADAEVRDKETALLRRMHGQVRVPEVLHSDDSCGDTPAPFAVLEFIHGRPLSEVTEGPKRMPGVREVAGSVGRELARIGRIKFEKSGLLGPDAEVAHEFRDFAEEMISYIGCGIAAIAGRRLGVERADRVLRFVDSCAPDFRTLDRTSYLTHADFNAKNILIEHHPDGWRVAAVLDWEFALSASPYFDLGNMLRYEEDLPGGFAAAFVEGYESIAGPLDGNWRRTAAALDLCNQIEFLSGPGENPRRFADAIRCVDKTLSRFTT